jgi:hypothetical protein
MFINMILISLILPIQIFFLRHVASAEGISCSTHCQSLGRQPEAAWADPEFKPDCRGVCSRKKCWDPQKAQVTRIEENDPDPAMLIAHRK